MIETKLKELGYENLLDIHPETLSFLKDLRSSEIEELKDSLEFSRKTKTISKFFKWTILTAVGIFLTFTTLWETVVKWKVGIISALFK